MRPLLLLLQTIRPAQYRRNLSATQPPTPTKRLLAVLFGKYLLVTNTVSSGLLMVAGDAVAQRIEYQQDEHGAAAEKAPTGIMHIDAKRIAQMFVVGAAQGPIQHYFYGWLDQRFVAVTAAAVAKKIVLDQLIMSPICIVTFFATASMVEKQAFAEFWDELSSKFLTIYVSDWMIWPFVQFINFKYVPAPYRVMYVNAITMIYNVWLSYVKHNDLDISHYIKKRRDADDGGDASSPSRDAKSATGETVDKTTVL